MRDEFWVERNAKASFAAQHLNCDNKFQKGSNLLEISHSAQSWWFYWMKRHGMGLDYCLAWGKIIKLKFNSVRIRSMLRKHKKLGTNSPWNDNWLKKINAAYQNMLGLNELKKSPDANGLNCNNNYHAYLDGDYDLELKTHLHGIYFLFVVFVKFVKYK